MSLVRYEPVPTPGRVEYWISAPRASELNSLKYPWQQRAKAYAAVGIPLKASYGPTQGRMVAAFSRSPTAFIVGTSRHQRVAGWLDGFQRTLSGPTSHDRIA